MPTVIVVGVEKEGQKLLVKQQPLRTSGLDPGDLLGG